MGTGVSTNPEYAFYVPEVKHAIINQRRKAGADGEKEKRLGLDKEMKARKMLAKVQKKHKKDVQRESAEATAKATASYFKHTEEHHRRLSRLHSIHGHDNGLFDAVAATARRASVLNDSTSIPKKADSRSRTSVMDDSIVKDSTKHNGYRRLSRLHTLPTHDEDLFASAVAATAKRASIADDGSGRNEDLISGRQTPSNQTGRSEEHGTDTISASIETSSSGAILLKEEDVFQTSVAATACRDSTATATDHVYVKNAENIQKTNRVSLATMPPIEERREHMDEGMTTSPDDPMAAQFNQVISTIGNQATEAGQDGGTFTITLKYEQFLDIINERKTLREALEETGAGVSIKIKGSDSDEGVVPAVNADSKPDASRTEASGIITDNTVLNITQITDDSGDLVENLINSVSQILAVNESKTSQLHDLDESSELMTFSKTDMKLQSDECQQETSQTGVISDAQVTESTLEETVAETSRHTCDIDKEQPDLQTHTKTSPDVEAASALPLPESVIDVKLDENMEIEVKDQYTCFQTKDVYERLILQTHIETSLDVDAAAALPLPESETDVKVDEKMETKVSSIIQTEDVKETGVRAESVSGIESKVLSVILTEAVADVIADAATNVLNESAQGDKGVSTDTFSTDVPSESTYLSKSVKSTAPDVIKDIPLKFPDGVNENISTDIPAETVDVSPGTYDRHADGIINALDKISSDALVDAKDVSVNSPVVCCADIQSPTPSSKGEVSYESSSKKDDNVADGHSETRSKEDEVVEAVQSKTSAIKDDVVADGQSGISSKKSVVVAQDQSETSSRKEARNLQCELHLNSEVGDVHKDMEIKIDAPSDSDIPEPRVTSNIPIQEDEVVKSGEEFPVKQKYRLSELEKTKKLEVPTTDIAEGSLENLLIEDILSSTTDTRLLVLPDLPTVIRDVRDKPDNDNTHDMDNHGENDNSSRSASEEVKDGMVLGETIKVTIQENDEYPLTESQLNCVIGAYAGTKLSQKSLRKVRASICEGFLPQKETVDNENISENSSAKPLEV